MEVETGSTRTIALAVVEDEPLMSDLLRVALAQLPGFAVVGVFADAETALHEIPLVRPLVAVLDIDLGRGLSGIQLGMMLRESVPGLGIVLLSNLWVPRFIASLPPEVMAGWCYLLKKSLTDVAALGRAIEGAAAGLVVLDPHVVADREPRPPTALARLTPRQREILALLAQGFTNASIADRLVLAPSSVENQLHAIYAELGFSDGHTELNPRVRATLAYLLQSQPPEDRQSQDSGPLIRGDRTRA
ncbi:MAG TPA: response regulator transcription factor [Chloroflexota bacterium]|nr:response regulator transcription factor [Chloroflexota bacterium]